MIIAAFREVKDFIIPRKYRGANYIAGVILRFAVSIMLLGRGWKYFFFETSFREIFWSKNLFAWFVEGVCNLNWNTYLSNAKYDGYIEYFEQGLGLVFFITALAVVFLNNNKFLRAFLLAITFLQLPQAYFMFAGQWFNWPLLLEFSAQFFSPLLLWYFLKFGLNNRLILIIKVVIATTFICHAYYALGIFKVPNSFYFLTQRTIGLVKNEALIFLQLAGVLDVVAAILIFIPSKKLIKVGLYYMVFWGFFTALARPVAFYYSFDAARSIFQHLPDMLIRFPHFMLPLFLLYNTRTDKIV